MSQSLRASGRGPTQSDRLRSRLTAERGNDVAGEPSRSPDLPHSLVRDGRLRLIPRKPHLRAAVLDWVVGDFARDRTYTEPEVNAVLRRRHDDVATLRRYLVDAGLLCRTVSGAAYWRAETPSSATTRASQPTRPSHGKA
jgi:hypothetical protein